MPDLPFEPNPEWHKYMKAREAEWVIKDGKDVVSDVTQIFESEATKAAAKIVWLAEHAEPRLSFEANKYIIERVLGKSGDRPKSTKLEELVAKLAGND